MADLKQNVTTISNPANLSPIFKSRQSNAWYETMKSQPVRCDAFAIMMFLNLETVLKAQTVTSFACLGGLRRIIIQLSYTVRIPMF